MSSTTTTTNANPPQPFDYDFNYPSLNRKDLIYSRCLDGTDFKLRKFKQLDTKRDWSLNNYNLDIKGAAPKRIAPFSQKEDFSINITDIAKASPKQLYPTYHNKPDYTLSNRDIEKSMPKGHDCSFKSNRHVNPLEPQYTLPSCNDKFEVFQPKFLRDNIDVSDIAGAQPRKYLKWEKRDNMSMYDDIVRYDYQKKKKLFQSQPRYDYMNCKDINNKHVIKGRGCGPLDPEYTLGYYGGVKYSYGHVEGSKPNAFSRYHTEQFGYNLRTDDIEGAQTGTKGDLQLFKLKHGRPLRYSAEDIVGAKSDTLKKGMVTNRCTNPVDPRYRMLGGEELKEEGNGRYNGEWVKKKEEMKEEGMKVKEKEDVKREDDKTTTITTTAVKKDVKGNDDIFEEFKELPYVKDE
jgi:hypothetical protein